MEGGVKLFNKEKMKLKMNIDGTINGIPFKVTGDGSGKPGDFSFHAHCTTGSLPLSWVSMGSTLMYGFSMFTHYPNGIYDWFKDQFPEGYTMDRTIEFEGDGVFNLHYDYELKGDTVIATVAFKGEGFSPDGPIMADKISHACPNLLNVFPTPEGPRSDFTYTYQLKDGTYLISHYNTRYHAKRSDPEPRQPLYHHKVQHVVVLKDVSEKRDHAVLRETMQAIAVETVTSAIDAKVVIPRPISAY